VAQQQQNFSLVHAVIIIIIIIKLPGACCIQYVCQICL
jgi:hypothetical protein